MPHRTVLGDGAVDLEGRLWFAGSNDGARGLTVFDGKSSQTFLEGLGGGAEFAVDGRGRNYSGLLGLTIVDPSQLTSTAVGPT